jgi:hypothetical protein
MKIILIISVFLICSDCLAKQEPEVVSNPFYKSQIDSLNYFDQKVRSRRNTHLNRHYHKTLKENGDQSKRRFLKGKEAHENWIRTDSSNISTLLRLVDQFGFPSQQEVGWRSHYLAVIMFFHFDRDTNNQILLPILDSALAKKEIEPIWYARIIDRHRYLYDYPQLYYTYDFCSFLNLTKEEQEKVLEEQRKIGLMEFKFKCSTFGEEHSF